MGFTPNSKHVIYLMGVTPRLGGKWQFLRVFSLYYSNRASPQPMPRPTYASPPPHASPHPMPHPTVCLAPLYFSLPHCSPFSKKSWSVHGLCPSSTSANARHYTTYIHTLPKFQYAGTHTSWNTHFIGTHTSCPI